jgi:cobalt-zinc-cadmium efflux system membrane fusion protein
MINKLNIPDLPENVPFDYFREFGIGRSLLRFFQNNCPDRIKMKKYMKNLILNFGMIVLLFTPAILLQSCGEKQKAVEEKVKYIIPDSLLKTLLIDTVMKCPLVNALSLTGMVDFNQDKQVNIYSLVSGNIQEIKVQLGDYVAAGQILAVVKSSEMAGYGNNLLVAQSNLAATKKQLEAATELYKSGLASILDVTTAQTNYDQAKSQLELAKRILKINGNDTLGDYIIKSPINGFIVQKNVTNNTLVRTDNGTNLFTISDLKDVWVQANVYEANIELVHIGDKVEVRTLAAPDRVFTGEINQILNVLDPASKVIKVRIVLNNPDYVLKPQMFASVIVSNPANRDALCIPSKALVYDHSQYYVVKYNGKGDADITPVEVLSTLGDKTYLKSGIKEGDKIIASIALQIYSELNN